MPAFIIYATFMAIVLIVAGAAIVSVYRSNKRDRAELEEKEERARRRDLDE
jgi:hypothetical protein